MDMIVAERELEVMPFDMVFDTLDGQELCHATGREVQFAGNDTWWNEYIDSQGNLWYGR